MTEHKHTNRLINETSPYLRQHAHNPVDWHPWSDEAFALAKRDNKPVLLSIGYSACHWCHVMEHESFENEAIAQLMNDNFVSIKVDREERPDLDQIYMNAVQMMTHHGGWPMTVFLTPEGVPFYGGTYFPPEDRHNMMGFPRVLVSVAQAYREQPDEITKNAVALLTELRRTNTPGESSETLTQELLETAYRGIARNYDRTNGGFGGAPKFPPAMTLEFLLRVYYRTKNEEALDIVTETCSRMSEGGIYDQLGGGFHRYATDAKWLVPHFEKMLYDNALLSRLYLHYYQTTHSQEALRVATGILDYVVREMTDVSGGFYSTQDADSEGHEGKFFVWSKEEITALLGAEDARLFSAYYNVTAGGNFEGENILNVTRSIADVAESENVSSESLRGALDRGVKKLFEIREQRVKPDRDEKVLTAWNGLMLTSFAEAAGILEREDYADVARRNARFVLGSLKHDGRLRRTYKDGQAKLNGYLEDYAFLIDGLLSLFETTGEFEWLAEATSLARTMIDEFWDENEGGFFFTGRSHEVLIVRSKDYFDNATPSGNSVAADVLLRLGVLTGDADYTRRAVTVFRLIANAVQRYPSGFGRVLCALDFHLSSPKEIVLLGAKGSADTSRLRREVWKNFLPNKVFMQASEADSAANPTIPLLQGRRMLNDQATAFVCEQYTCQQPVTRPEDLAIQLSTSRTANST
jgi:uncharacterized protein